MPINSTDIKGLYKQLENTVNKIGLDNTYQALVKAPVQVIYGDTAIVKTIIELTCKAFYVSKTAVFCEKEVEENKTKTKSIKRKKHARYVMCSLFKDFTDMNAHDMSMMFSPPKSKPTVWRYINIDVIYKKNKKEQAAVLNKYEEIKQKIKDNINKQ